MFRDSSKLGWEVEALSLRRNESSKGPTRTTSFCLSCTGCTTRRPLTKVPLALPRSTTKYSSSCL